MSGETDLAVLLRDLDPALDPIEYGFGLVAAEGTIPGRLRLLGLFEEEEGTTLIAAAGDLAALGIGHQPGWARITLRVHSSLTASGLTAAVSGALAEAGIPANLVAAYHHDHVFVPWERRDDAMAALERLSREGWRSYRPGR